MEKNRAVVEKRRMYAFLIFIFYFLVCDILSDIFVTIFGICDFSISLVYCDFYLSL